MLTCVRRIPCVPCVALPTSRQIARGLQQCQCTCLLRRTKSDRWHSHCIDGRCQTPSRYNGRARRQTGCSCDFSTRLGVPSGLSRRRQRAAGRPQRPINLGAADEGRHARALPCSACSQSAFVRSSLMPSRTIQGRNHDICFNAREMIAPDDQGARASGHNETSLAAPPRGTVRPGAAWLCRYQRLEIMEISYTAALAPRGTVVWII